MLDDSPELGIVDADFQHLFSSWFNRGFLVLRRIDWHTPANILEKIIQYEAVHAINNWHELRRRLLPDDRRCFAFFHPAMPEEPLIFVEIALCRGIPNSVQNLLSDEQVPLPPAEADTAVFYSISNCQEGLKGISFGNLLIKQVVEELAAEITTLKTFVTLSPVPGFQRWLGRIAAERPDLETLLEEISAKDASVISSNQPLLRALCAEYLLEAKGPTGRPLDPVARFHLGNGATLHDIHALADMSANGWEQSSTLMVNYLYDLAQVNRNSERYMSQGEISASRQVRQLVRRDKTGKNT
jgi:malonyl-CoA decarboxylase